MGMRVTRRAIPQWQQKAALGMGNSLPQLWQNFGGAGLDTFLTGIFCCTPYNDEKEEPMALLFTELVEPIKDAEMGLTESDELSSINKKDQKKWNFFSFFTLDWKNWKNCLYFALDWEKWKKNGKIVYFSHWIGKIEKNGKKWKNSLYFALDWKNWKNGKKNWKNCLYFTLDWENWKNGKKNWKNCLYFALDWKNWKKMEKLSVFCIGFKIGIGRRHLMDFEWSKRHCVRKKWSFWLTSFFQTFRLRRGRVELLFGASLTSKPIKVWVSVWFREPVGIVTKWKNKK